MKENEAKPVKSPNRRGINALGVLKLPLFLMILAILFALCEHPIISALFAASALFHIIVISVPSLISSLCIASIKDCKYKEGEFWSQFGLGWCTFLKLERTGILPRSFSWDCLFTSTLIQSYLQQSRFEEALAKSKEMMTILEEAQDHDGAAKTGGQMAFCLIVMGRLREAENILDRTIPFLENAMRYCERENDLKARAYRARLCGSLFEKAFLFETKRDFKKAEKIRRQALTEAEILSQNDDESAIMTHLCMLSKCLYHLEELEEAENLARRVLDHRQKNLKSDHVLLSSARQALGRVLCAKNNLDEAQIHLEAALKDTVKVVGEKHPDIPGYKCDLAKLRIKQRRLEDAEKLLLQAIEQTELIQGKDHPNIIDYQLALADLKDQAGRATQAQEARLKARNLEEAIMQK
ncbi:MAG: tetratricopeptide repeat protein [Candidatus Melainabacteria bacterium]|nr:tetratricopeptide repeat protein [Candidatus Melainabacteria bacterium]